jgi:(p)ppGpp synthase/HD superfamily hydrolase
MLSDRFDDALGFAAQLHRDQRRKGAETPYIAHLLSVAALTLEYHGDEDCAIAALLHDAVEDQGGLAIAKTIENRFGARVARIVIECSDRGDDQDTPWHTRKTRYIASLADKSADAVLVTSCDKLHNATAILEDIVSEGLSVFNRFSAPRADVIWYYRELAEALQNRAPGPLTARLSKTVAQIEYWVSVAD